MSASKFVMAFKLASVQKELMSKSINDTSLDGLTSLIFKACIKENLCFWFNFLENECVLNLRDISHENYELNIRQYYETGSDLDEIKKTVLINAFLITKDNVSLENASSEKSEEPFIISGDKPVPKHIRDAIEKIQAKGIPVTPETIRNHLPTGKMSTNATIQCNNYLKKMEASQ